MCINPIKDFQMLAEQAVKTTGRRPRVAVVNPADDHTRQAVARALGCDMAVFAIYAAPGLTIEGSELAPYADRLEIITCSDADDAARRAVTAAREGQVDIIMKGLINTDNLMRAILNKEYGILPAGHVLSHITVTEPAGFGRLLFFSDAAVIPYPTLEQRTAIAGYLIDAIRRFGISRPRVALIHCTEKTSPKFPVTLDYAALKEKCAAGDFGNALIDGPMDVKTACDAESARIKGIQSDVCGNADALIFSDIQAANVFYKTITCFNHALTAGVVVGAKVPVVVPSRSDSAAAKFYSLALACLLAR